MHERSLALIGMMGAGKSTVGRLVADRMGRSFIDSDAEIEMRTGLTVAQIFERHGEKAFRDLEAMVVSEAVCADTPVVTGVAGGAVMREETREVLRERAHVVWIEVPIDVLIERVTRRRTVRPLIKDDPDGTMRRLYEERRPLYASVADDVVHSERQGAPVVADRIMELVS